jgi:hypothetical protein
MIDPHLITLLVGVIGAVMVGIHSWSKFDEPSSYSSQSEHFARYKPRFATSRILYTKAKVAYTSIVITIYVALSTVPGLLAAFGVTAPTGPSVPLFVALAITTLQSVPAFKDIEQKIRGFLHALARIPERIRRAVSQMRIAPFAITPAAMDIQNRKITLLCGENMELPMSFGALMTEDEAFHTWSNTGALLTALSEENRSQTGIDLLFFDYYKDELDSISAKHGILAEQIAQRLCRRGERCGPLDSSYQVFLSNVRDLRDRLYTFVACGVISSARNAAEEVEILRSLGFSISPTSGKIPMIPLLATSVIAMLVLSIITAFLVTVFRANVFSGIDETWRAVFPIPELPFETYTWSWSAAAFYLATIFSALLVRNTRVVQRQWFDMNNLERERPVFLYATPILVGTFSGWLMLSVIAFVGGPGFNPSLPLSLSEIGQKFVRALISSALWLPVAVVMATVVVTLSDAQFGGQRSWRRNITINALAGGLLMAVVGFFNTKMVVTNLVAEHAGGAEVPQKIEQIEYFVDAFIAFNIGVITFILCFIVQMFEVTRTKALVLEGKSLAISTRQGLMFN